MLGQHLPQPSAFKNFFVLVCPFNYIYKRRSKAILERLGEKTSVSFDFGRAIDLILLLGAFLPYPLHSSLEDLNRRFQLPGPLSETLMFVTFRLGRLPWSLK